MKSEKSHSKWWNHLPKNSNIWSKKTLFWPKKISQKIQESLFYRPKQCTIVRKIPQNHHTSALSDPPKYGSHLMTPDISNTPRFLQANRSLIPIPQCIPDPTAALPDADNASSSPGTTIDEELGNDFFLKWRVEVIEHSYWNPWKFLEDAMKFCECCSLDALPN